MRKTLFTLVALSAFVAVPAYAATISLAPTTISVTKGQTFTMTVSANGTGTKVYTVKAGVSYPASMLEVTGFKLDPAWPLTPPGNSIDNTNGRLVQTGGFVGGFSDTKTFGVITFKAKESGSATIAVASDSAVYDSQSKNVLSGTQGTSAVTIAQATTPVTPVTSQTPTPKPQTTSATGQNVTNVTAEAESETAEEALAEDSVAGSQSSLMANVFSALTFGTGSMLLGILSVLVILLAAYGIYREVYKVIIKNKTS